jgi:hypothetical protein
MGYGHRHDRRHRRAKSAPADIAAAIVTALQANQDEVLTDAISQPVKAGFAAPRSAYLGEPRAKPVAPRAPH